MGSARQRLRQNLINCSMKQSLSTRIGSAWRTLWGNNGSKTITKGMGGSTVATSQHPLQKMLSTSMKWEHIGDSRRKLALSRLLIRALPFFKRAIQMQADFVGRPVFHSDDPNVEKALNDWAKSVPIVFLDNMEYRWYSGLANYAAMLVRTGLTDGMAFSEEVYGELDDLAALMVFPTERFTLASRTTREMVLRYTDPAGYVVDVQQSDHFHAFGLSFMPGSLWGLSMTDGGEFFSELLVQMLVARKNNYLRLGNPPGLNIFTLKNHENFTDQDYEEFKARVDETEKRFMEAIYASQQGQNAEVFGRLAGEVDFTHKIYGEGAQGLTGFREDVEWAARQLSLLTGIPPEFLGFETGSAGIGADKFRILNGLLTSTVEGIQNLLLPILTKIARNWLISSGAPATWMDSFWIEFSEPDINDKKAHEETGKLQAEKLGKHIENASKLWFELGLGDVQQINEYFIEVGLPWLQLTSIPAGGGNPGGGGE